MKRLLVLLLSVIMVMSTLTACNAKQKNKDESNPSKSSSTIDNQSSVTSTTEQSEPSTEAMGASPTGPVKGLSEKYVDYNNLTFAVNGKAYKLGVNTLQDMIDDGVPFEKSDITDATTSAKPNYESPGFRIVLGEYYYAQVFFSNYTSGSVSFADCVLSKVYMPVNLDLSQNIIQFSFPLTITEKELIANAGEPTDKREYKSDDGKFVTRYIDYLKDSKTYIGGTGYKFEFANDSLRYLYIIYLP